jgi:hypothetical protein
VKTSYRTTDRATESIRLGMVVAVVVMLVVAIASVVSQGDICDKAKDPQQCRAQFPDR